ncbi:hypothetical protein CYD53_104128 [Bosea psychrotolerans]|uniref:Uncharacterized protein n=1 Tax=Bosea psychrotolerans TaxID=1871628 RepID=A0A2S4MEG2_9HYPH|nr:hypothetical protein CYD53_104128 [Bosea psychrotolerans]
MRHQPLTSVPGGLREARDPKRVMVGLAPTILGTSALWSRDSRDKPENDGKGCDQSRSNSLMPVFERVWASTVLTMTAQESEGPGVPSGKGLPGSEPGTTTE